MALMHTTVKVTEDRLLELPPEVQQALRLSPGQEIEIQLDQVTSLIPNEDKHFYFTASDEQFQAVLAEIAQMNKNLPALLDDAFDRETLYEDRV